MTDLALAPLTAVAQRLQTGDLSPVELTRHLLDRIARLDPRFHSYVTVLDEQAMAQARAAEADLLRGRSRGPLHGIPVAVKDSVLHHQESHDLWSADVPRLAT